MIVTKTEKSVDWRFQGTGMGEQTSWVGRGLFKGFIYFRYSHDGLGKFEEIVREKYFVDLSDGTTYPLGEGAAAEKITIINHGVQADGDVCIEVIGKPDVGVGVSAVWRDITFTYDDGRTPVLDTDQLAGILSDLSDHLTASMHETAEHVKEELRDEIETEVIDAKREMTKALESTAQETLTEVDSRIDTAKSDTLTEVDSRIGTSKTETMTEVDSKIATAKTQVTTAVSKNIQIAQLAIGQRNIAFNTGTYLIDSTTTTVWRPNEISYSAARNAILLPRRNYPRIMRLTVTGNFTNCAGIIFGIKDSSGNIVSQSVNWEDYDRVNKVLTIDVFLAPAAGDQSQLLAMGRPFLDSAVNTTPQLRIENAKLTIEVLSGDPVAGS